MRVLLDACVLMPARLREMLLGAAAAGGYAPLWSARILEEWARAARRLPDGSEALARAEIAHLSAAWPEAQVAATPDLEARLSLPDPDDVHVLAAALTGGADILVTRNLRDFPARTLARHGLRAQGPDGFLCDLAAGGLALAPVAEAVRARAGAVSGEPPRLRAMLKRCGLPRLGKLLDP